MAWQTAAGASLAISLTAPATFTEAGYSALTPKVVGEVTNVGEFGKEFALVTHNPLAERGTGKRKGSYNNGTLSPTMALDPSDEGQQDMETALESDQPAYFQVTLQDGTAYWLAGLVMSYRPTVGGVDDVVTAACTIEVDSTPIVKIPAA
ncbi:phage tail tube protein [Falsirhodobacter sp. 20TX0035]|uniref:phage tail tube protein n=1 Tax=Falsirhodobacter sp. 20TX0035 TaxID=3022019 RepID=UPI00232F5FAF|nr:phage tail tube protein [Falsirhodobacter sp. 20TX0035]MDB6454694.1 phage tail tube protein [Falsirhodobacter sp. 20TX0035]